MKKTMKEVKIASIRHCDWNPRTEEELKPEHPKMSELVASVRQVGVLQPICVWRDIVIAGNRRFEAAKIVGLEKIQAVIYDGIDDATAREITRVENEVRLGVNPIEDAALIGQMLRLGYSQKEVAAHFGVSEATVCRRVKLCDLIPEIKSIARDGGLSTDAIERISRYTPDIQKKCLKMVKGAAETSRKAGDDARWSQLEWTFSREVKSLDNAKFDTGLCCGCYKRTGAQADLWDDVSGKLGMCLDCECFAKKNSERIEGLARKVARGAEIVDGTPLLYWYSAKDRKEFGDRKSKSRPALWYWYQEWDDELNTLWGPDANMWQEIRNREDAEAAAKEEESKANDKKREELRKRHEEWDRERDSVVSVMVKRAEALNDVLTGIDDDFVDETFGAIVFKGDEASDVLAAALRIGLEEWSFNDDHPDGVARILKANAKLRDVLGIKQDDVDAVLEAKNDLDKWESENPEPK